MSVGCANGRFVNKKKERQGGNSTSGITGRKEKKDASRLWEWQVCK